MERTNVLKIRRYADAVPSSFVNRDLQKGDIIVVRMRFKDREGDEGLYRCTPASFDPELYSEDKCYELVPPDDIVGRE